MKTDITINIEFEEKIILIDALEVYEKHMQKGLDENSNVDHTKIFDRTLKTVREMIEQLNKM